MELTLAARPKALALLFIVVAAFAVVNLIHNLSSLPMAGDREPLPVDVRGPGIFPDIQGPVQTVLFIGISLFTLGMFAAVFLKYRPRVGKFPYGELVFVVALILLVLALAILVTPSKELPLEEENGQGGEGTIPNGGGGEGSTNGENPGGLPLSLAVDPNLAGLLLLLAISFIGIFLMSTLRHRRAASRREGLMEVPPEEVVQSLETTIYRLQMGDDIRSTILECYRDLISLFRGRGLETPPHLTAREVEEVALGSLGLLPPAARTLRGLFEVARYSLHPLGGADREAALSALRGVRDELGA